MIDTTSGVGMLLAHTAAAGAAEFPTFPWSIRKSALQLGQPMPQMGFGQLCRASASGSLAGAGVIGIQLTSQGLLERRLSQVESLGSWGILISSMIVAGISAPVMALHNGYSMGLPARETLRRLTWSQGSMIAGREFGFLQGVAMSQPLTEYLEAVMGEGPASRWSASLLSGTLGGIFGHPADTILTCWQRGNAPPSFRYLMRGVAPRTTGIALFTLFYNEMKRHL